MIIDSSIEEGIELTGPLDEWLNEISKDGEIKSLNEAPSYLDSSLWNPETNDRSWEWKIVRNQSKLVYRVASMEIEKSVVRTHRSGFLGRDKIQRAGLASIESRKPKLPPLNPNGLIVAAENEVLSDQLSRRRTGDDLQIGQIHTFASASQRILSSDMKLIPTKTKPANARDSEVWPHLGIMAKKALEFQSILDQSNLLQPL